MDSPRWTLWLLWAVWALALAGLAVVVAGARPQPRPETASVERPPWWLWLLGLVGLALLLYAWPFPVPPERPRLARGLQRRSGGRLPWWLPWLLAALGTLAVGVSLVALQLAGRQGHRGRGVVARRVQRSRGMDGPHWLGWLTVAALALRFAAPSACTRLRPTP